MERDEERRAHMRRALSEAHIDAMVLRLPENLVLAAGYWPVIGHSLAVLFPDRDPVLLAPAMEREALERATVGDVRTFRVWHVPDDPPDVTLQRLLTDVLARAGADRPGRRVAYDGLGTTGWEEVSPSQKLLEPLAPGRPGTDMVQRAAHEATLVDAAPLLARERGRKTAFEVERLRVANEIAAMGLRAFAQTVDSGRTEAEIGAAVEAAVHAGGTGYRGTRHARAQALVFSGPERLMEFGWGYAPTSSRRVGAGEVVLLELAVVADGYLTDLSRVRVAGRASPQVREMWAVVRRAHDAAVAALVPGRGWAEADAVARQVIAAAGWGEAFYHHLGHGVGFRYHEAIPLLHPAAQGRLEEGMVTTVEPGVYGPGVGGLRLEDAVLVTASGGVVLSPGYEELEG